MTPAAFWKYLGLAALTIVPGAFLVLGGWLILQRLRERAGRDSDPTLITPDAPLGTGTFERLSAFAARWLVPTCLAVLVPLAVVLS